MKKLAFFIVLALLVSLAVPSFAAQLYDNKYVITNTTATTKVTNVPAAIIDYKNARIVKMTVTPTLPAGASSTECMAALYDTTASSGYIGAYLEGEIETSAEESVSYQWIRPLKLYNGVTIAQGAYTVVELEWEEGL